MLINPSPRVTYIFYELYSLIIPFNTSFSWGLKISKSSSRETLIEPDPLMMTWLFCINDFVSDWFDWIGI